LILNIYNTCQMYSVKKLPGRPKDINVCCPSVKVGNKYINPVRY